MRAEYRYIVCEGNIGAGKTSLATLLAKQHNAQLVLEEFEDNSFLPGFYRDPEKYAFPLELSFLADRYHQMKALNHDELIVSDYHISKSLAFADENLSDDELDLFRRMYEIMNPKLRLPDILLYLDWELDALLENIKKRGREYEKDITRDYLQAVQNKYTEIFSKLTDVPIVIVKCDNLDFINDAGHYRQVVSILDQPFDSGVHRLDF